MFRTPLHCASRLGNLLVVEELLRHSVEVETKDGEAITALWAASFAGHADVVELLLSHGADTEVKATNNKATALRVASQKGHRNVVKYLLQAGANVNAKNIAWSVTLLQSFPKNLLAKFLVYYSIRFLFYNSWHVGKKKVQGYISLNIDIKCNSVSGS